jgi:hypothetical protein
MGTCFELFRIQPFELCFIGRFVLLKERTRFGSRLKTAFCRRSQRRYLAAAE